MRTPHRGDRPRMTARRKPVEQLGADRPAPHHAVSRVDRAFAPRHHQHHPRAHRAGLIDPRHDPVIGGIERVAMQVERQIGLHPPALHPAVPVGIEAFLILPLERRGTRQWLVERRARFDERGFRSGLGRFHELARWSWSAGLARPSTTIGGPPTLKGRTGALLARQRLDARGEVRPRRLLTDRKPPRCSRHRWPARRAAASLGNST